MIKTYTLKNGLRVVTENLPHMNSISFGVMIKNGSRNESENLSGISHFIEHMFFKGTEKRTAKDIVEEIENVGGQLNAYTSKEATCYYVKALNTHLSLAMDVISDMLLHSTFLEEELEKEKSVVIEEINMSEDLPEDVLDDLSHKITYKNDMLGNPILGTNSTVKSFTRDVLKKYIKEKYTPSNSVVSICGKFDEEEVKELLEKYFGDWEEKNNYVPVYDTLEINNGTGYINKDIEQLHINLTLKGYPYAHENGYALVLVNNIFGGGASSMLFQKVREELGLCYTVYSYLNPYIGSGSLNIYTGLSKGQAPKALEAINNEIVKFSKEEISKELIEINKEKTKAGYILGLESTSSRMFGNAKAMLFRGYIKTEEEVLKDVDKISSENIHEALQYSFGQGIINSAFVGPEININELNSIINLENYAYNNKNDNGILRV